MGDISPERKAGCGILNAVFGRNSFWLGRSTSASVLSTPNHNNNVTKSPSTPNSRRRRGGSDETAFLESTSKGLEVVAPRPTTRPSSVSHQKASITHHQNQSRFTADAVVPGGGAGVGGRKSSNGYVNQGKQVPKEAIGISGELESMINDHQKVKGSSTLVRASSSNVMLFGNLGNLRQPGVGNTNPGGNNVCGHQPQPADEYSHYSQPNRGHTKSGTCNKDNNDYGYGNSKSSQAAPSSLCRAISTRMDPETLKIMGNEDYKNGRFVEALALYDAAISIDPNKASYRRNKSAALTALGRILEAVFECREAIRIEPRYQRAHNRIATLYVRLGEAEKAIYHYKHAGPEADPQDIAKAKTLQALLQKCTEAQKLRDWNSLIRESSRAISSGGDSAPQIFALQAEAFLKLHRHQEADETVSKGPNFEVDACTKFLGPIGSANMLTVRAQVDIAAGRFDNALDVAQQATRLDPNNRVAAIVMKRARAVAAARSKGNELFKAGRFSEACIAYSEGLEHDHYNSVLLCNRAACRSKLGQFEKAIEDCTAALDVRPSYSKARLRRADCNAKLGRWEASVQDYEVLIIETPDDEEVASAFLEAKEQLKRQQGGASADTNQERTNLIAISSIEEFRQYTASRAISIAYFYNKPGERQMLQIMEQLCRRHPSVNFLKVEVEDNSPILKFKGPELLPSFIFYKNGSMIREIHGDDPETLESVIDDLTS
ncbi:inactive TPR repeat-containing thioredoxin TTL3-like [Punica granatum]|uniref:Inactive TPR repeat-containing thioredoxin TTL3-like n=1 Tax=Punica granatum TaxID=22663 RepID=A0A6P8CU30_PUNGR|nr:inactive TPR repeat-containing thioredoxin TTL3-like [Punica granatum]